ncbi:MAG: NAD-dependent deacylase [Bacteroidetes bacterium]|nr:NAD-dependent deacylase [Bacteroidota bacterium]
MSKKKIVVLTGAGISAESGIKTFRDSDGLWEEHDIMDVATYEAWLRNKELVIEFYNQRRKQLFEVEPNAGHYAIVKLEDKFDVFVVTQNVDDLHERAGSKNVMHLHGELKKVRSTVDEDLVYVLDGWELKIGDKCEKGSQLRPHIVWFGEAVPMIYEAAQLASNADIIIIVGTSLNVYPAAGLVGYAKQGTPVYLVDPGDINTAHIQNLTFIKEKGCVGVPKLVDELLQKG